MVNLSKRILTTTGFLLSMLLLNCSIQKRTLRPGFHVERIGALNKKPSLHVQAQETADLPVLPNVSVGLSHTPRASEAFTKHTNPVSGNKLASLAAVTPPQTIESRGWQHELRPVQSDSTSTSLIEGQVASSSLEELMGKIAKTEKARKIFVWLAVLSCPLILTTPFFLFFAGWKKSQLTALRKDANLPYKLAWYHTGWLWISLPLWPVFLIALTCRHIDRHRIENGKEPMSWKSKTIFFTLLFIIVFLLASPPGLDFDFNFKP